MAGLRLPTPTPMLADSTDFYTRFIWYSSTLYCINDLTTSLDIQRSSLSTRAV